MPGIHEVFEIVDRATAPLRNIANSFTSASDMATQLGTASQTAATQMGQSMTTAAQGFTSADRASREFKGGVDDAAESMKNATQEANGLQTALGKLVAGFATFKTVQAAISLSDELSLTQTRLNNINDGLQTTAELQEMIYQSAQRSRGSYTGMMQTVASLKAQTGDTFSSVREAVAFTELLQKQFKIAGTDATGIASTMYNLTQALSTGVLRGQDLNIVMSNAPQIAQRIAKYMGVSLGTLKDIASKGQVTSDVVKAAMLSAADDINEQFDKMPLTFADAVQRIKNMAVKAFEPIGQMIADAVNSGEAQTAIDGIGNAIYILAGIAGAFVTAFGNGLSIISGALIDTGGNVGWLGDVFVFLSGLVGAVVSVIYNAFAQLCNFIITVVETVQNTWAEATSASLTAVKNFVLGSANAFRSVASAADSAASAIANAFINAANGAIGGINGLIDAINQIPGMNIGKVGTIGAFGGTNFAGMVDAAIAGIEALDTSPTLKLYERLPAQPFHDAFTSGRDAGKNWASDLLNGMNALTDAANGNENTPPGSGGDPVSVVPTGGKVGKVGKVDNVKLSDEDMKIYRDLAERRYMNNIELKTLAPEINVTLPAGASGNLSAQDVADRLKKMLIEQMAAQTAVAHG